MLLGRALEIWSGSNDNITRGIDGDSRSRSRNSNPSLLASLRRNVMRVGLGKNSHHGYTPRQLFVEMIIRMCPVCFVRRKSRGEVSAVNLHD